MPPQIPIHDINGRKEIPSLPHIVKTVEVKIAIGPETPTITSGCPLNKANSTPHDPVESKTFSILSM